MDFNKSNFESTHISPIDHNNKASSDAFKQASIEFNKKLSHVDKSIELDDYILAQLNKFTPDDECNQSMMYIGNKKIESIDSSLIQVESYESTDSVNEINIR